MTHRRLAGISLLMLVSSCGGGQSAAEEAEQEAALECSLDAFTGKPGAFQKCDALCARGSVDACTTLATMYRDGKQTGQDQQKAYALFGKSCSAGDAIACTYAEPGPARVAGSAKACLNTEKARDVKDLCTESGLAYLDGVGVAIDRPLAEKLLKKGCSGGRFEACEQFEFKPPTE